MINSTPIPGHKSNFIPVAVAIATLGWILFLLTPVAFASEESTLIQTELPQPDIPKPQFFCGYCHVLTYPDVVNKGYELWKKGKHNKVGCVECHYPPAAEQAPASAEGKKHIPKIPPERFSYVKLGGESVQTRPRVVDASCMTANCHGSPKDTFKTKKKMLEQYP